MMTTRSLFVWRIGRITALACLLGCGGGGSGGTKVTSALVADDAGACFVQGEIGSGSCLPDTRFHCVLTDGRETETFVLGEGDFRVPVCGDGFFGFTGMTADLPPARCNPGQSIPCADVARYETTTEELCKS